MLNILATERMKIRRDKLILVCTLIAVIFPIVMISNAGPGSSSDRGVISWISTYSLMYQLIVYPILSGMILTFLIHREYSDQTLLNTLSAPVSRMKFLIGKVIVWMTWHIVITVTFLVIMCVSVYILYGNTLFHDNLLEIIKLIMKSGLLNLGTLTPVIWIAILQRKTFYPSLMCTMLFTGIGFIGLYGSNLLGNIVPWIAVTFMNVGREVILLFAYASIAICTISGLFMAMLAFSRQDL